MEPADQQQRIDELFSQALEIQLADREAYLVRIGESEPREVIDELRSMLRVYDKEQLNTPLVQDCPMPFVGWDARGDAAQAMVGRRVGRFQIERCLGSGGYGDVYLARRCEEFDHEVAIKLIQPLRALDGGVLERFERERQALARLRHPHIAQLLDGGTTEDGLPYLVMEYVEGQPITQYCDEHGLSIPERLKLFQHVCSAVSAAHQMGYLHRDLKPANILVTRDGTAKLLDFGIAKLVSPIEVPGASAAADDGERDTLTLTQQRAFLGTPRYASPEQIRCDAPALGPPSDVYALGVLLYELLAGRSPYEFSRDSWSEYERVICEETPIAPSKAVSAGARAGSDKSAGASGNASGNATASRLETTSTPQRRVLRGDLDTIVLTALQKDPERRYASPAALSDDIDRWLEHLPIRARPDAVSYRVRKFVDRNRLLVSSTLVIFLLLVAAVVGTGLGLWQARREARRVSEHLYAAEMELAGRLWEERLTVQAEQQLAAAAPEGLGGDDLRGWEWSHLHNVLHPEELRFAAHDQPVSRVAADPTGRRMASAQDGGLLLVWDADDGTVVYRGTPLSEALSSMAFSPDGNRLAVGGYDSEVAIVDLESGQVTHRLSGHALSVTDIAFSTTGGWLATASQDSTIRLWDSETGAPRDVLVGHQAAVTQLWFHQTEPRLASLGADRVLRFWDVETGEQDVPSALERLPSTLALSPDFTQLALWQSPSIYILSTADLAVISHLPGYLSPASSLRFDRAGNQLATADGDGDVVVWDLADPGKPQRILPVNARSIGFLADGQRLYGICQDDSIRLWSTNDDQRLEISGHDLSVTAAAFSPDGRLLASAENSGRVRILDAQTGETVHVLGTHVVVRGPHNPDRIAAIRERHKPNSLRHTIHFQPAADGTFAPDQLSAVLVFAGHGASVQALDFSPDGRLLASCDDSGVVLLWDVATGRQVRELVHPLTTPGLAFDSDGNRLVTACWDSIVRIWDVATGEPVHELLGHERNVTAVAVHPLKGEIASADADGILRIWEPSTKKCLRIIEAHSEWIDALAYSPGGEVLASASRDHLIHLWDTASGARLRRLQGHTERVTSLAFHPHEIRLVSASNHSADAMLRFWDWRIGRQVLSLSGHSARAIDFDAAGERLAVSAGKRVQVWTPKDDSRSKTIARVSAPRSSPQSPSVPADFSVKPLGYFLARELQQLQEQQRLLPASETAAFTILVVSMPHQRLLPSKSQIEQIREQDIENYEVSRLCPDDYYALLDRRRFVLHNEAGERQTPIAIGGLPSAIERGGGFSTNVIAEKWSAPLAPQRRMLVGLVFDGNLAADDGPWEIVIDQHETIPFPRLDLQNFTARLTAETAEEDALLAARTTFYVLKKVSGTFLGK